MLSHTVHLLFNNKLDELEELYISVALRTLALAMVGIFVPLYLLDLNYSITQIIYFFIVLKTIGGLFVIPSIFISKQIGFKHTAAASLPITLGSFLLMYFLDTNPWLYFVAAITFGLSDSMFWSAYNIEFSHNSEKKYRGEELGVSMIFRLVAAFIGPIIGGFIIGFGSFKFLFVTVALVCALSVVPLLMTRDEKPNHEVTMGDIFKNRKLKDALPFLGFGVEHIVAIVMWPMFIFTIIGSYSTLGTIVSFSIFFSIIITLVIGKIADKRRRFLLNTSSVAVSIIWILRNFVTSTLQVLIIDPAYNLSKAAIIIPFNSRTYDKSSGEDGVSYIAFREIMIKTGAVVCLVLFIPFVGNMSVVFGFAAVASLLYMLI